MGESNPRTLAILNGQIKPDGIDLIPTVAFGSELFWRQLKFSEFDVSEMSMSQLLIATAEGDSEWVGLPIFPQRRFFHVGIWVRTDRGIQQPGDLRGKRLGVPEYQQTAALWQRGALQHEFGVFPKDIEWFMERTPERSHADIKGFEPPPGVRVNRIPAEKSIGSMLMSGELDGALHYLHGNNLVDRSRVRLAERSEVRLLFTDGLAEGRRYFVKTGLYPVNHGMVVRRSIYEKHPWVVLNIYNAFRKAKEAWLERLAAEALPYVQTGLLPPEANDNLKRDLFPYGVVANRALLETLALYSHEQGLTPRLVKPEELFPPNTHAI
jgi:4,5-dihydroxyphthalate decarboxylase